jgi:hypothetical protein
MDLIYERLLDVPREDLDHWFWRQMNGHESGLGVDLPFSILSLTVRCRFAFICSARPRSLRRIRPPHSIRFKRPVDR